MSLTAEIIKSIIKHYYLNYFCMFNLSFIKKIKITKNVILVVIAVIAIIVTGVLIFLNSNHGFAIPNIFGMSNSKIAEKVVNYINDNKLSSAPASSVSVSESSGLVKIKIKIGTQQFDSYATKDGKLLFPQAFDMTANDNSPSDSAAGSKKTHEQAAASIQKTDNPMLEAFIVSGCPFGLQMQRLMADAINSVPSLASNMKVKYIGSVSNGTITAMHGDYEAQKNLRQICIREEEPAKYWNYVSCYMKKSVGADPSSKMPYGDTKGCEIATGIDIAKLNTCVSDSSRGLAYAQKDFSSADKYGVSGSPTLILGDSTVSEFDFGGRTSDAIKSIICAAYKTQPGFCSTKLNTANAATSFAPSYSSGASENSNASANCNTAQ